MQKKFIVFGLICTLLVMAVSFAPQRAITTKAQLGELLFNEKILSKDLSVSCASCHKPQFGFADTTAFSLGIDGRATTRNTPSVLNMKFRDKFFWDGRAATLEEQCLIPIANPNEMGLPVNLAVVRLNANLNYKNLFIKIFKQVPNRKNLAAAFAAYEKTLETWNTKFDNSIDDKEFLTESEERGRVLFIGDKAKCFECHNGFDFTNDAFKNIGMYNGKDMNDAGRYDITKKKEDLGAFKTPGLRNVAITAPYMHNGRFKTLEEVVEFYNNPDAFVPNAINIDTLLQAPLGLNKQEKADLVAFMETLTDKRYKN